MELSVCVECMTRPKIIAWMHFLRALCIMMVFGFLAIAVLTGNFIAFIIMLAAAGGVWFFNRHYYVEFEYTYVDKELTVDKIFHKMSRKRVDVYNMEQLEIFAPIESHHLDEYKNRQLTTLDYAAGKADPDPRYVMILEGSKRLIIEPSEGLVQALKSIAPRKVFTD